MMLNLSAALGRVVLSGRELARLSGFSSRVTGLIDVIDDVNRGVHKKGCAPSVPCDDASGTAASAAELRAPQMLTAGVAHPMRNAGVAGVNLAIEHTPRWAGGKSLPRQKELEGDVNANPSTKTDVRDADTRQADGRTSSTNVASHAVTAPTEKGSETAGPAESEHDDAGGWRLSASPKSSHVSGQPELAPELNGVRTAPDGTSGHGGGQLQRSGSVLLNENRVIEFENVPLVTPAGDVLIQALSFRVSLCQIILPRSLTGICWFLRLLSDLLGTLHSGQGKCISGSLVPVENTLPRTAGVHCIAITNS